MSFLRWMMVPITDHRSTSILPGAVEGDHRSLVHSSGELASAVSMSQTIGGVTGRQFNQGNMLGHIVRIAPKVRMENLSNLRPLVGSSQCVRVTPVYLSPHVRMFAVYLMI